MSDTQNKNNNDYFFVMFPILMMMFALIIINSNNSDPNSLLTDEQKLEKQKEIELQNQEKEIQNEKNAKWWNDSINYFIKERPFPYAHFIGVVILLITIKQYTTWSEYRGLRGALTNPNFIIPAIVLFYYLAWLSGYIRLGI